MKRIIEGDILRLSDNKFDELFNKVKLKGYKLIENKGTVISVDGDKITSLMNVDTGSYTSCIKVKTSKENLEVLEFVNVNIKIERKLKDILESLSGEKGLEYLFDEIKSYSVRNGYDYLSLDVIDEVPLIRAISFDKIEDKDIFSYKQSEVEDYINSDFYKKRSVAFKPIKLLNKILKTKIENMDIINKIIYLLSSKEVYEFQIVSGSDISKYYNGEHYIYGDSSLNHSCMRGDECSGYFQLYEDNVKMVILKDKILDKIYGRAILWPNVDALINGKKEICNVMDRIYVCRDYLYDAFYEFAKEQGVTYTTSTCPYPDNWMHKGELYRLQDEIKFKFKLCKDLDCYDEFPYIDTMALAKELSDDTLYSGGDDTYGYDVEFHSTDGWYYDNSCDDDDDEYYDD